MSCYLDKRVVRHLADLFWTIGRIVRNTNTSFAVSGILQKNFKIKAFTYIRNYDEMHNVTQSIIVDFNSFLKI